MRLMVKDLSHWFPDQAPLFEGLTFELGPGQLVAATGPSGSGKSTLLSLLSGSVTPCRGLIEREGVERVAWVFQNPLGIPGRLALDHVVLPLLARGARRRMAEGRARDVLAKFGLEDTAELPFHALSGGQAQRLMLARAVTSGADLVLVDEPTALLDSASALTVIDVLSGLGGAGAIIVIATHDQRVQQACSSEISLGAS